MTTHTIPAFQMDTLVTLKRVKLPALTADGGHATKIDLTVHFKEDHTSSRSLEYSIQTNPHETQHGRQQAPPFTPPTPTMAIFSQLEPTPPHVTYLILAFFLICYTLFAQFIRNRLHLSEPPLALVFGILLGPRILGWLTPNVRGVNGPSDQDATGVGGWGWGDDIGEFSTPVIRYMQR